MSNKTKSKYYVCYTCGEDYDEESHASAEEAAVAYANSRHIDNGDEVEVFESVGKFVVEHTVKKKVEKTEKKKK